MDALIADDDPSVRKALRMIVSRRGYTVMEAADGAEAIETLGTRPVDVIITDLVMPRANGFDVLRYARERHPTTPVIILTAEGSIRDCVEAIRAGAFNFLTKPFRAADLEEMIDNAVASRGSTAKGRSGRDDLSQPQMALIGESEALRKVIDTVERIAANGSTVLITGESGTGKEVVARLVHSSSPRAGGPFVPINCGAIPETLIESELFGHAKGAFTGATEARQGRFVQADGGTLFLDEVGELPLPLQVRLLRVLQEREVTPVGDNKSRRIDVRIIAATNRDLEAMVAARTFRQDLFYRLEILPIKLPALRERNQDIPILAAHFLEAANRRLGRRAVLSDEALSLMRLYAWPGNVREIENLLERLVVMSAGDTIKAADLPDRMRKESGSSEIADASAALARGPIDFQARIAAVERVLIGQALRLADGNRSKAAELLGLSRTTLLDKLKRLEG